MDHFGETVNGGRDGVGTGVLNPNLNRNLNLSILKERD
jgi:hypothetical protein